jgi:hypothetical protein
MMSSGTRVNWRKGFFRVWVLGAVLWMPLSALVVAGELSEANASNYSQVAAVALIPPLLVLIAGLALGWVYRGFRAS